MDTMDEQNDEFYPIQKFLRLNERNKEAVFWWYVVEWSIK